MHTLLNKYRPIRNAQFYMAYSTTVNLSGSTPNQTNHTDHTDQTNQLNDLVIEITHVLSINLLLFS
jgi:hypothetical protein